MKTYQAQCHCGNVKFEIETDFGDLFQCNCSFCIRRSALLNKVPATQFRLLNGEASLSQYGARDFSKHFFCATCGIQCFTCISRTTEESVAVNVGCIENLDQELPEPRLFDGARLL